MAPGTTYAESPDGAIAYQVFGDGSVDLVFVTQWGTNIDNYGMNPLQHDISTGWPASPG